MIILIAGATHTGKTLLAQKLLERYHYPYLSLDQLKMGLIRSQQTDLTVEDDDQLTSYLWKIVQEIIKTAVENKQNLIVEGIYIPFDWEKSFTGQYLAEIKYYCLVMTPSYIQKYGQDILCYESTIEQRQSETTVLADLIIENKRNWQLCQKNHVQMVLIDDDYFKDISRVLNLY